MDILLHAGGAGKKAFQSSSFLALSDAPHVYTGSAGKGVKVNATETGLEFYTLVGTDEHVAITAADTTPGYLNGKLLAGTNISFAVGTPGGNETLTIACTALDEKLKVTATDSTADYLDNKILVGNGLASSVLNPGANEQLTIAVEHTVTTGVLPKAADANNWEDSDLSNVNPGQAVLNHISNPGHYLTIGGADFASVISSAGALVYNVN